MKNRDVRRYMTRWYESLVLNCALIVMILGAYCAPGTQQLFFN